MVATETWTRNPVCLSLGITLDTLEEEMVSTGDNSEDAVVRLCMDETLISNKFATGDIFTNAVDQQPDISNAHHGRRGSCLLLQMAQGQRLQLQTKRFQTNFVATLQTGTALLQTGTSTTRTSSIVGQQGAV